LRVRDGRVVPSGNIVSFPEHMTVAALAPGLVVVRGALSESEQKFILEKTNELGARETNGFAAAGTSGRERIYDEVGRVPAEFTELAIRSSQVASAYDADMPACSPSHVLINKYSNAAGLLWHRDIYSNDGDGDMPVINLSIGASSCFGVTLLLPDKTSQRFGVELRSGDAILFGGPSRFIEHAVLGVMLDKKPTWMTEDPCRMSLTFRAAPSVSGREEFFRNFKIKGDWFQRTQTEWREGDPLVEPEE